MKLFDVHTHVQFNAFKEDQNKVIKRALGAGVWMINVGTQRDTSLAAIKLANEYEEGVYATVGLHPIHTSKSFHDAMELGSPSTVSTGAQGGEHGRTTNLGFSSREEAFDYDFYKNLAADVKVVAIGECGLDYYRNENQESGIKNQEKAFRAQIELAIELKKPLMVHCRDAFSDLIKILNSYFLIHNSSNPGVVHFFSGTVENAKELMDLGFSFSFGGVITFAREYEKLIKYIPLERILLETDAPYVAPIPYRGQRNEPAYIVEVANKISRVKGSPLDQVAETTFQNAKKIFLS